MSMTEGLVLAANKWRESTVWWLSVDRGVHEFRCAAVRYLLFRRLLLADDGLSLSGLAYMRGQVDRLHDRMITIRDNIMVAAECAVGCEIAARIHEEDVEGLELALAEEAAERRHG